MNIEEMQKVYESLTPEQIEVMEMIFAAKSCSPMSGRYAKVNKVFEDAGSEYALNRNRVIMECCYLVAFCDSVREVLSEKKAHIELSKEEDRLLTTVILKEKERDYILSVGDEENFTVFEHLKIKEIEKTTNHDVKAIEYYLRRVFCAKKLKRLIPFIHIGITSEDTNNVAYALIMHDNLKVWMEKAIEFTIAMQKLAEDTMDMPMLGHTHGQPATPLTFGLAMATEWMRLDDAIADIIEAENGISVKVKGAVGNMAACKVAFPDLNTIHLEERFVKILNNYAKTNFQITKLSSQIEPHDYIIRILDSIKNFSNLVSHIARDHMWEYISRGYVIQVPKAGEVGSSTMPHKVNPINAENAWSNSETASFNANGITQKLSVSIMQRDLSDSSTLRTIPYVFMHSYQAISEMVKLLGKIKVNEQKMLDDLENNPEVLSEAIQTVLRKNGVEDAYEVMKEMTRGQHVTLETLREFISTLDIAEEDKQILLSLEPKDYVGYSYQLVHMYV